MTASAASWTSLYSAVFGKNFCVFALQSRRLSQGHVVFNPCENDAKTYGSDILDNETGDPTISEAEHGFSLRRALKDRNRVAGHGR
jgi:hypothetical protein